MAQTPTVQPQGDRPPAKIGDLLRSSGTIKRFQQIVPRHLSPERMLRVMAHATHKTPRLLECEPITLLGAMLASAGLGLEANTPLQHSFLIPFKKTKKVGDQWIETYEVQLVIGYRGFIDLARRSGELVSIHADVVYEGDMFSYEYGSSAHLRHKPCGRRDTPLEAYAYARLKSGEEFEVLPYPLVLAIRDESQGYKAALAAKEEAERNPRKAWRLREYETAPWVRYEHPMARKTMVRQLSKWLPLSMEFANAVKLDQMSEAGKIDFAAFVDNPEAIHEPDLATISTKEPQQLAASPTIEEPPTPPSTPEGAGVGGGQPETPTGPVADPAGRPQLFGAES